MFVFTLLPTTVLVFQSNQGWRGNQERKLPSTNLRRYKCNRYHSIKPINKGNAQNRQKLALRSAVSFVIVNHYWETIVLQWDKFWYCIGKNASENTWSIIWYRLIIEIITMFHCSALAGNIVYKRNHDFFKGKKIFSAPRIFMFLSTNRSKEVVEEDDEHQAFFQRVWWLLP